VKPAGRRRLAALLALAAVAAAFAAGGSVLGRSDRWTAHTPATLARTEVGAARIGHRIYVVGGYEQQTRATTRAVERYDIRGDRWKRVRSMPVGINHAAAVAYQGKLYVHGGYRGAAGVVSARLYAYNPRRDRWLRLPSSPTPRAAQAAAVIGHRLYVAGGAGTSGSLRSLEIYNFRARRWRRGPDFLGPARNHTTGAASGGRFYVIAGRDGGNLRAVDRYSPKTGSWSRMPPLRTARGGIASARLQDGRIAVFGGEQQREGNQTIAEVEVFDPAGLRWRRLPPLRTPRHGLGGAARGRRLFAIEGGPRPGLFFSRAIEVLDVPETR
jgi:N-acetylneuraminic acid mutarotase